MNEITTRRASIVPTVLLVLFGLFIVAGLLSLNWLFVQKYAGGAEFRVYWTAGRALLFEKANPYGQEVALQVQRAVYGHSAPQGVYPYYLDVPFYLFLLYLPLALIPSFSWAFAAWMLLSEVGILVVAFGSVYLAEWKPNLFMLGMFLLLAFLWPYSLLALTNGSVSILLAALYVLILLALRFGQDELVGALIALVTFKWEVGLPFLLLVVIWSFTHKRRRLIYGFGMVMFVLVATASLIRAGWFLSFAGATLANLRTDVGLTPGELFARLWLANGSRLGLGLTAVLFVVLFLEWYAARRSDFRHFYWIACLTLTLTPLLGFSSRPENFVVMLMPLALVLSVTIGRWKRGGIWLAYLLILSLSVGIWLLLGFGVLNSFLLYGLAVYLFLPVLLMIGLYWLRWWALQPPLTWLDVVSKNKV